MPKKLLLLSFLVLLLAACASPEPEIVDNGNPGSIRIVTYFDEDRSATFDSSESGISLDVAIAQDIACPAGNETTMVRQTTDADGVYSFENLAPGRYCAMLMSNIPTTTPIAVEVFLSSDQEVEVRFGLAEGP